LALREDTVRLWRSDFTAGGVAALKASIAPGPPPVTSDAALRVVAPWLEEPVADRRNWTIPAFAPRSRRARACISRSQLSKVLCEAGEGWSDSAISSALDTSINNVGRTRRRLVDKGFEAVLTREYNPNSAPPRIFDRAAEAKLIALTCSPAPEGFARWSLRLLEEKGAN
jgi:hypothetical protein